MIDGTIVVKPAPILLEQPAAGDQRGLKLLVIGDRVFHGRERSGSGRPVAANHE
jgi:hypothetical protein